MNIILPHEYTPRDYQLPLFQAIDNGIKRALTVWHRRSGKDKTDINLLINQAMQRVGAYYYYFPTLAMGRKILWDGMDKGGMKFMDHIPKEIRAKRANEHEMKITLVNGSTFQLAGTDRLDVVGTNPVGCVFSEYSLQNPRVWDFIRPILVENDGWAVVNGTPRGKNHLWTLKNMAENNDEWFYSLLTVDDTGAISAKAIEAEREQGMSEALIQQEFYCSFEYGQEGSYFAELISKMYKDGRITELPVAESSLVHTAWDIGMGDSTAIWFFQEAGGWYHLIDYYEMNGTSVDHYVKVLKDKERNLNYNYGTHYAPHDIEVRDWSAEKTQTRRKVAEDLGVKFKTLPKIRYKQDSIDSARKILPMCRIDRVKCKHGINSLQNYMKQWNEKMQVFADKPLHNWASDGADAFQCFAMAVELHGTSSTSMTEADCKKLESMYTYPGAI
jgi:hypothetical protein